MAEPFSVAGSAVGVISLAITTCQGVISYYNSWDTQDQSISDAKGKIERLHSSLSALEEILPKISSSSAIAAEVEQCVLSCKEGTARLQKFLGKCRENAAPLNFRDRLRDCRQRAIFPFRQSSLDSLKEIVRDLENNLGTALQVLQLDNSEAQTRRTSDLVDLTKSTAVSVEGASHYISNVEQKVDQVLVALSQIQLGVTQYASHGPILRSSITTMERRTQAIESFTSQILPDLHNKLDQLPVRIQESLAESIAPAGASPSVELPGLASREAAISKYLTDMDEDARRLQFVLAQRPSLLRTVCDGVGGLEMDLGRTPMMTPQNLSGQDRRIWKRTKHRSYCSCATLIRRRAATYSIGRVDFFKSSVESSSHSFTCPLYIGTKATTTVGFKMGCYGRLLANTVRATISITTGAGGYSMNPGLKFHAIVPNSSPAFSLLDSEIFQERFCTTPARQSKEVSDYFQSTLQQLYDLFKHRRASPTDTNPYGETLLHACCGLADQLEPFDVDSSQSYQTLLKGLVVAGVPLNDTAGWGGSALDMLAGHRIETERLQSQQILFEIVMMMSTAGAELSNRWFVFDSPHVDSRVWELKLYINSNELIENSNFGPLSAAIIRQSENETERLLQNSPQCVHEQNSQGQTPLHLSCSWPKGITLIFHHGGLKLVDREDNKGWLPLAYSCATQCSEAIRLMLEADSALLSSQSAYKIDSFGESQDHLFAISERTSPEIRSYLYDALVDRRSRLMSLAITHLCREELGDLEISHDRLLDKNAFAVYTTLEGKNVVIPSALRVPFYQTTVFHGHRLTPAIGESLYRYGFLDIDGIDSLGFTPLMVTPFPPWGPIKPTLQRASWLVSKGADPGPKAERHEHRVYTPSTTGAHCLCEWLGQALCWGAEAEAPRTQLFEITRACLFGKLDVLEGDSRAFLSNLISLELYDSCLCACSSQGCTPAIMIVKGLSNQSLVWGIRRPPISRTSILSMHLSMSEWMNGLLGHRYGVWQRLSQEIIRYETFEKLQLTHTCCTSTNRCLYVQDSTEREEIQDEERLLISKLETLVAEFTKKYTDLGVSLPDFLKGYWKTRMEEIEREEEPLDDEEIAKIEELGVVIHS